jgi:hypothetical protein
MSENSFLRGCRNLVLGSSEGDPGRRFALPPAIFFDAFSVRLRTPTLTLVIIYLTREQPLGYYLLVASQNKQFNQSENRNRPAVRRGLVLSTSLLSLALPQNQVARPMSSQSDVCFPVYRLHFLA